MVISFRFQNFFTKITAQSCILRRLGVGSLLAGFSLVVISLFNYLFAFLLFFRFIVDSFLATRSELRLDPPFKLLEFLNVFLFYLNFYKVNK